MGCFRVQGAVPKNEVLGLGIREARDVELRLYSAELKLQIFISFHFLFHYPSRTYITLNYPKE